VTDAKPEEKDQMLDITTELREERIALIDRLYVILDELNEKLGKTAEGTDNEKVVPHTRLNYSTCTETTTLTSISTNNLVAHFDVI
jgi:hypothetical protein